MFGERSPTSLWYFQAIDVLALVMPSCESGATSLSSLNTVKTRKGNKSPQQKAKLDQRRDQLQASRLLG